MKEKLTQRLGKHKKLALFTICILFSLPFLAYASDKPLSLEEQQTICLSVINEISEIDRAVTAPSDRLKEAVLDANISKNNLLQVANQALESAQEAKDAYMRIQLNLPNGLPEETEAALNTMAYEMKLAYSIKTSVYSSFIENLKKYGDRKLDQSSNGEIWGHIAMAIEAEKAAKESIGIE
jgi:hypothetical protein